MKDSIGKFLIIAIVFLLTMLIMLTGCEKEEFTQDPECCTSSRIKPNVSPIQQTCCDWDAVNFDPEWNEKYFMRKNLLPDIYRHFDEYGVEYFKDLNIWHIPQLNARRTNNA